MCDECFHKLELFSMFRVRAVVTEKHLLSVADANKEVEEKVWYFDLILSIYSYNVFIIYENKIQTYTYLNLKCIKI
jgi:hypothetical protein